MLPKIFEARLPISDEIKEFQDRVQEIIIDDDEKYNVPAMCTHRNFEAHVAAP
jgi:hypothetical protein